MADISINIVGIGLFGHAMTSVEPLCMPIQHPLDSVRAPLPFLRTAHGDTL